MKNNHNFSVLLTYLFTSSLILLASNASASQWMYKQSKEELTDKQYSFAAGFAFDYEYNNDFTTSFQCSDGKVRFEIDADTLITSKGKTFHFVYRVDKRDAKELTMTVFSNENQGGYTYDNVNEIAKNILGGKKMFVRAITWDNEYLEANISLDGSDNSIRKVFKDCSVNLSDSNQTQESSYSFNEFSNDFKKLTPANQQEILDELQKLIEKY